MSLASKLTMAIEQYAGTPDTNDSVSFQLDRGRIICFIRGVGAHGKTPEIALTKALAEWARISRPRTRGTKRRRTSRRAR